MKTIHRRLEDLEGKIPTEDKPVWFEEIDGKLFARYADNRMVEVEEVTPGYKLYKGVSPCDWDE